MKNRRIYEASVEVCLPRTLSEDFYKRLPELLKKNNGFASRIKQSGEETVWSLQNFIFRAYENRTQFMADVNAFAAEILKPHPKADPSDGDVGAIYVLPVSQGTEEARKRMESWKRAAKHGRSKESAPNV